MNTTSRALKKIIRRSLAIIAVVVVGLESGPASAASATNTVGIVEYSAGILIVQLSSGVNYSGWLSGFQPSGCNVSNVDTLKAWQSLAQAALLSGKTLGVYFTTCGSPAVNQIASIDLNKT